MPHYVGLMKFTEAGRKDLSHSPDRVAAARQAADKLGIKMHLTLYTMGEYDVVAIAEAPDDETMIKLSAAVSAQGTVTTMTMRAFTPDEFRQLTSNLPG